MKILLLDNYDSFTFNLLHLLEQVEGVEAEVVRNDQIDLDSGASFDAFLLSPGPGLPDDAGMLKPLISRYILQKKMLGVCLGHQAIAQVAGATLFNLEKVRHGLATTTRIIDTLDPLFRGFPSTFKTGHYHSWMVSGEGFPPSLQSLAIDSEGNTMALRLKGLPVWGVQFHPESILTEYGKELIVNWLKA